MVIFYLLFIIYIHFKVYFLNFFSTARKYTAKIYPWNLFINTFGTQFKILLIILLLLLLLSKRAKCLFRQLALNDLSLASGQQAVLIIESCRTLLVTVPGSHRDVVQFYSSDVLERCMWDLRATFRFKKHHS